LNAKIKTGCERWIEVMMRTIGNSRAELFAYWLNNLYDAHYPRLRFKISGKHL
jgi:hypothetical protein